MLKLTVAVLAVVLAGTASAAGWRSLRVDGTSEEAFAKSLEAFKEKLSPARQEVFELALEDIWVQGTKEAVNAAEREYTASDYYRQLDGLSYEEIVTFTDPTGDLAQMRYRAAKERALYASRSAPQWNSVPNSSPWPARVPPPVENGEYRGRPNPNQQQ